MWRFSQIKEDRNPPLADAILCWIPAFAGMTRSKSLIAGAYFFIGIGVIRSSLTPDLRERQEKVSDPFNFVLNPFTIATIPYRTKKSIRSV
jgi:hypothetical protein